MATFKYVAVGPDGTKVKATVERRQRGRAAQRAARAATSRSRRSREKQELQRDRAHASSACRAQEIMHFSRQMAAFVRAGIPITDALEVVAEGVEQQAVHGDPRSRSRSAPRRRAVLRRARRARERLPAVLHRHPALGRASPAGSTSCSTSSSSYIERDLEARSKIKSALDVPDRDPGHVDRHRGRPRWCFVLPKFDDVLQGARRRSCRCSTRMLLGVADFFRTTGGRSLGRRRSSASR